MRVKSLLPLALALFTLPALAADSFWIVKITDMDKKVEHKIMSAEDYKALEAEVRQETALFQKAEELAKKEWKAADEKGPFPGRLNPRKVEVIERHTVREKADAKLQKIDEAEDKKFEPKKVGKTEAEKKMLEAKAEKEKELKTAYDMVKAKLDELTAAAKEKDAAKPKADEKP